MLLNRVAVAAHGPILCEDEATPSRKPFKYLPCPFWAFPDPKIINIVNIYKLKTSIFFAGSLGELFEVLHLNIGSALRR